MSEVDSVVSGDALPTPSANAAVGVATHLPPVPRAVKPKVCEECGLRAFGPAGRRMRFCPLCLDATYCSRACQRLAWSAHYLECGPRSRMRTTRGALKCRACEDEL